MSDSRHSLVHGHLRVGDLDVAYMEFPTVESGFKHWYLAAGEFGVAMARPFSDGPLVPGRPSASVAEIEDWFAVTLSEGRQTSDEDIVMAFDEGIGVRDMHGRLDGLLKDLGCETSRRRDDALPDLRDFGAGVRRRLGKRITILGLYKNETRNGEPLTVSSGHRSERAAKARALRLTDGEATSLIEFAHASMALPTSYGSESSNPLLRLALELADVRLEASVQSIRESILALAGVPATAIRRLPTSIAISIPLIRAMRSLPSDWMPSSQAKQEWVALSRAADSLTMLETQEDDWPRLVNGCKGHWVSFMERCVRAAYADELKKREGENLTAYVPGIARHARDVARGFEAFLAEVHAENRPLAAYHRHRIAVEATMGGLSLPSILENSRLWHTRFKAMAPPGVRWRAILPKWVHPETGIEVVPLTNSDALVEEGAAMDHCVGGVSFTLGSLRNETRIVSLRKDGKRVTTAEIALYEDPSAKPLEGGIVQHHGLANSTPSDEAVAALAAYVVLPEFEEARRRSKVNVKRMPKRSEADLTGLLETWRPYLTGKWKRASLEDFREALKKAIAAGAAGLE